jgi:phosphate/sulfate permease
MTEIPVAAAVLVACFALIVVQEAVHGFHDCANAIAPVVATRALAPRFAVPLAAVGNLLGVVIGGTAITFELVYLLPTGMVAGIDNRNEVVFLLALVATIIFWNAGTWWLGIPNATTHSYVGAILGTATAYAAVYHTRAEGVAYWHEGATIITALFLSPVLGFVVAALLFFAVRALAGRRETTYENEAPPWPVRSTLITGSAAVSFMHGSNDGQKSIALMMLILIGLAPGQYGFDRHPDSAEVAALRRAMATITDIGERYGHVLEVAAYARVLKQSARVAALLDTGQAITQLPRAEQVRFRGDILDVQRAVNAVITTGSDEGVLAEEDRRALRVARKALDHYIDAVPLWVTFASAFAFAIGGAIGYRRIVETIGSRIGKSPLDAVQATATHVGAVACIALADATGAPVSTTHLVSSGVAGSMVASRAGVRFAVARNIVVVWIVTLPATMAIAYVLSLAMHGLLA